MKNMTLAEKLLEIENINYYLAHCWQPQLDELKNQISQITPIPLIAPAVGGPIFIYSKRARDIRRCDPDNFGIATCSTNCHNHFLSFAATTRSSK